MKEPKVTECDVSDIICGISDVPLRRFMFYVFSHGNLLPSFMAAAGSTSQHHAYPGGLAYHCVHAARLGAQIAGHYKRLDRKIDIDLVIAGILLHDIGKIKAYEVKGLNQETGKWTIDKTAHERLYHHIPTGILMINKLIDEYNRTDDVALSGLSIDQSLRDKLLHIILSHHGRKAWSSPVLPQFLEAYVVHIVEFMDGVVDKFDAGEIPLTIYDH